MGQCKIPRPTDPGAAARAEVVELLFAYVEKIRAHFETVAQAHDLTPVQAKVVLFLGQPEPMRCIADSLSCDPSNITGVVARLEERGLLSRVEDPTDRRVKFLQATPTGKKLRESFELALFRDVPGMKGLTRAQITEVRNALSMLGQTEPAERLAAVK